MSFYNATKNPFPFYKLEGEVWTNKKPLWFSNNCNYRYDKFPLFPGKRYFQLRVSDNIQNQNETILVKLRKASDNTIVPATINRTLYVHQKLNKKFVTIEVDIPTNYVDDQFYISVETDYGFHYSETFCVKNPNNFVGVVWSSSTGRVGDLIYPSGYKNYININAEVIPLEPEIEEETIENGFGEEKPTLQILKQGFVFSFMAPNFLAQALSALKLHDQVQIINRKRYDFDEDFDEDIKDVQVKVTPEEDACFSFVEISFVEETVIVTACKEDILAANNPPKADIVWNNTQTTEDRTCNAQQSCQQTLLVTEFTYDPDNNLDTLEWEESSNNGQSWIGKGNASGPGSTLSLSETDQGNYWYRLKAVDTYGAIGYSNILKYNVYEDASFANIANTDDIFCEELGAAKVFDIIGDVNQTVKVKVKVLSNYGHGFILSVKDRVSGNAVFSVNGGPAGTETDKLLSLDGAGIGRFVIDLCMKPCLNTTNVNASVQLTLFLDDNIQLGDSKFVISKYYNC